MLFGGILMTVLAASPSATEAQQFAKAKQWDELYLRFATGDAKGMSAGDRTTIAQTLGQGCEALLNDDAILAFSLADRAQVYAPEVAALRCLSRAARATQQLTVSEKALREGMRHFPKTGFFALELGRQLLDEQDPEGARDAFLKIPPGSSEAKEASALLAEARRRIGAEAAAKKEAAAVERRMEQGLQVASTSGGRREVQTSGSSVGPGGMRTRASARFVIRYFNNSRDFSERADYEGTIVAALEEAYGHTKRLLGEAREAPVDVVLYTREEFALHHGAQNAKFIAGLYSQNAMRINDAAELTRQTRATLVHEYVHAAVDDFISGSGGGSRVPTWLNEGLAEYVEWRYLGSDVPPDPLTRTRLRADALKKQQPRLAELADGMLIQRARPELAYATSGVAVRLLVDQSGANNLLRLIREVGSGTPFAEALQSRYGLSVEALDERVRQELTQR